MEPIDGMNEAPQQEAAAPKKEPRVLVIPEEHDMEVRELCDATSMAQKKGGGSVANALMWRRVYEIFPETKVGNWRIHAGSPIDVKVIEDVEIPSDLRDLLQAIRGMKEERIQ
jgi:hypothetical protein